MRLTLLLLLIGGTSSSMALKVTATYTLPTSSELAPYATFSLPNSILVQGEDKIELNYSLPLELVQKKLQQEAVHLMGTPEKFPTLFKVIDKDNGHEGQCLQNKRGLSCLVSYGFTPDPEEVIQFLKIKYPTEIDIRSRIAKFFSNEPGGIVYFPSN